VVGYGSVGGARAVEHLRTIAIELQMAPIRAGVHIQGADFFAAWQQGKDLRELTHLEPNVKGMLDELVWWTKALKTAREADANAAKAA
jgi:NAD(P)H-dependent FMN reductase